MKNPVLIIFFIVVFQDIALSQKCDSITINVRKDLASKRYHDSISSYFITGYITGDSIQKITERIELHKKDDILGYHNFEILVTYKFHQGILAETDDSVADKLGEGGDLNSFIPPENNSSSFIVPGNKIFKYSKEDDSLLRNSEVFINRK